MPNFLVLRSGQTYGVYVQPGTDGSGQELLEGGFPTLMAAERCRDRWDAQQLLNEVDLSTWEEDL